MEVIGMFGTFPRRIHGYVDLDGVLRIELTQREREVAQFIALGLKDDEIAARLGITPGTVKNYIRDIRLRLRVKTRRAIALQIVRMSAEQQPTEPEKHGS
jgi:DNA-binding NarL/FixJ family response regulator